MMNNYYQVYLNQVIDLAATIVVKSDEAIELMNRHVANYLGYPVDETQPETWKYYLNISGEYHPADTKMSVVSSDNLQTIEFNKQNLLQHKSTAKDYQYGTRQYQELVSQFPQQEMLILGILYPVDIDEAINAKNHAILGYPRHLVEHNEYSLIERLQEWTDGFFHRWFNPQYAISDDLYIVTNMGVYYNLLVPAILNLRLEACRSAEAHSYHVFQYLSSHSRVGEYHNFLTYEQTQYFYRNLSWIEHNSGMVETFGDLVENLMTVRQLPITEYSLEQQTTDLENVVVPELLFRRRDLGPVPSLGIPEVVTLSGILNKEEPVAKDNRVFSEDNFDQIHTQLSTSLSGSLETKLLESATIDFQSAVTDRLERVLLTHWLDWADRGLYTAYITVQNPRTSERLVLSAKEAYILMIYAYARSREVDLLEVPGVFAERVLRIPTPTAENLSSVVDSKYIFTKDVDFVLSTVPLIEPVFTIADFYEQGLAVQQASIQQRNFVAYQDEMNRRGYMYGLITRLYSDRYVELAPAGTLYTQWLQERNLYLDELSRSQFEDLYQSLLANATGMNLNTTLSLRNIQTAMVNLMTRLSSYSIQFIHQVADDEVDVINLPQIRVGDRKVTSHHHIQVPWEGLRVIQTRTQAVSRSHVDISTHAYDIRTETRAESHIYYDLNIGPRETVTDDPHYIPHPLSAISYWSADPLPDVLEGMIPCIGIEFFLALTDEQKHELAHLSR